MLDMEVKMEMMMMIILMMMMMMIVIRKEKEVTNLQEMKNQHQRKGERRTSRRTD